MITPEADNEQPVPCACILRPTDPTAPVCGTIAYWDGDILTLENELDGLSLSWMPPPPLADAIHAAFLNYWTTRKGNQP